jgi:O-antigen/teichoic acid export membrane protein
LPRNKVQVSKAQTFRNVIYNSMARGVTLACQFVASFVVVRNLSVADAGVVWFASIIINFLAHFSDCGVLNAAIRRPKMDDRSLETAFTLKVMLGSGAFAVALLLAPFAGFFCDHEAAGNVTRFLALNFLVSTIGFLPTVQLTRELNYRALVIPGVINAVTRCALAITLILNGWKFWSVVMADLGANLAAGLVLQFMRHVRLRFRFDRNEARALLRFGLPLMGAGLLVFLIFNLANFLVGAKLGVVQYGYYGLAFTYGSFICGLISDSVISVLFPTYAAIQHDNEKLRRWYLKTVDLVTFIAVVCNTALLANTHLFLVAFCGKGSDKWLPATVALQILSFYGILRAITEPLGNCMMVRNRTDRLWHAALLCGTIQVALLLVAMQTKKIEWVAASVLAAYASQWFIYLPFLRQELDISPADFLRQLWPAVPALAVGWEATHLLFAGSEGSLFALAGRGLFTATVAALTHGALTRFRCFQETKELVFQKLTGSLAKEKAPTTT